ncbi:biopolymer transporter ExbD [uncultured Sunxiuqinia sp.]|jgi:biopolymer transport protein ExbD|uniref:ExbD/TolR family protein n=1 Tax=uncultured Sunxiuqinia sp. TaxID=1573825 RepID=UPI00199A700E|nr:biopolymer transporter ExbD [Sunxiuqinia sp.]|tara:strand:+ start:58838 stop:59308 length:471 start_codon:yes stop_codon:yes gene_type:complete
MSKFRKSGSKEMPPISTASLPDIVFMLLFFFMVSTTMREVTLMVKVTVPAATELSKLEKKSLVSYIYVGTPHNQYQRVFGSEPRIQLNDQFARVTDIQDYITSEREARDEAEVPFMITSLKVDEYTKMGIVTDIKQELRKASALHINYSSRKREDL